jgi:hypothetical protein
VDEEIRYLTMRVMPGGGIGEGSYPALLNRTIAGAIADATESWDDHALMHGPLEWQDEESFGGGDALRAAQETDASIVAIGMTRDGEIQYQVERWETGA